MLTDIAQNTGKFHEKFFLMSRKFPLKFFSLDLQKISSKIFQKFLSLFKIS